VLSAAKKFSLPNCVTYSELVSLPRVFSVAS
jgi:hypothetical protein